MNIPAIKYYLKFYQDSYRPLLWSILASVLQSLALISIPYLVRYVFDDVIQSKDFHLLASIGVLIVLLYIISCVFSLIVRDVMLKTTKNAIQYFRDEIIKKFYSFSRKYLSEADLGKLHTIAVQDTERLDVMSNVLVAHFMPAVLISLGLCAFLMYLNIFLFLLLFGLVIIAILLSRPLNNMVNKRVRKYHKSFEVFSKSLLFVLQAMDLTRTQSAEDYEIDRQRKRFEELSSFGRSMAWLNTAYISINRTLYASYGVIILVVGGTAVIKGYMTLGDLLSFYVAVALLKGQYHMISVSTPQIIEGNQSLARLYELLIVEDSRPYSGTKRIDFQGKINLEAVHVELRDLPVLHDINLTIHPNTTVAIVGPNGAGKSTIANLILGFYRPQEGSLYADDRAFVDLDISHLRRHIGVVRQDPIIFAGTVWENITYGSPEISREQVLEASELAMVHEFIQQLPQGYDTHVGEGGVLLSGGQCQRIAIARALIHKPRLLILDEPTNHLDEAAVSQLLRNLRSLDYPQARLIISHDAVIVSEAKDIYVLKEGRIVSSGSYDSLNLREIKLAGVY